MREEQVLLVGVGEEAYPSALPVVGQGRQRGAPPFWALQGGRGPTSLQPTTPLQGRRMAGCGSTAA